jgi:PHD/YefM family antitoxin component YafN of YafNO toxin-antitoxin module
LNFFRGNEWFSDFFIYFCARKGKKVNQIKISTMEEAYTTFKKNPDVGAKPHDDQWLKVSIGTVGGILLGGGAVYATSLSDDTSLVEALDMAGVALGDVVIDEDKAEDSSDSDGQDSASDAQPSGLSSSAPPTAMPPVYTSAPVAHVSNDMSFAEAFASARAQVGPGGVFSWHGGVYGTYYETEWDAMSDGQRMEYAQSVHTEMPPRVYIEQHPIAEVHYHEPDVVIIEHHEPDVVIVNQPADDMHVLARGTVAGHEAVAVDVTGNNDPDVMIIDADDSHSLTEPDVVIDTEGNASTVGEIISGTGSGLTDEHIDTPETIAHADGTDVQDVAPEMPDYMDDAGISL